MSPTSSLQLDERQRAMLAEMKVRVWWPENEPVEAFLPPQPTEPTAPELIAGDAHSMGVVNEIDEKSRRSVPPVTRPVVSVAARHVPPELAAPPVPLRALGGLDWEPLRAQVADCQACGLCKGRKNTVFGVGDQQAEWMVVGEAPGENEDLQGEPFVGQAGKLLDNMLKAVGAGRHSKAYIANVIKCRPPGNRNPEPGEISQCLPFLERQIALVQPRIILAAGRFAANALLQESVPDVAALPLGKLRGKVYRYQGLPVVVTYHPAYLLRNLPEKAKAWADLCLAMEVLHGV